MFTAPAIVAYQQLKIDANLPELGWPCGLTFDTNRRRLILVSLGREEVMYSYEVDKNKWSVVQNASDSSLPRKRAFAKAGFDTRVVNDLGFVLTRIVTFRPTGNQYRQST